MDKFPDLLRTARKARGFTLEDLAARSGLNFATLYRYEAGERKPRAEHVITLANVLEQNGNDWLAAVGYPRVILPRRSRKSTSGMTVLVATV